MSVASENDREATNGRTASTGRTRSTWGETSSTESEGTDCASHHCCHNESNEEEEERGLHLDQKQTKRGDCAKAVQGSRAIYKMEQSQIELKILSSTGQWNQRQCCHGFTF